MAVKSDNLLDWLQNPGKSCSHQFILKRPKEETLSARFVRGGMEVLAPHVFTNQEIQQIL